jgi:anti-sigma factor RsiW
MMSCPEYKSLIDHYLDLDVSQKANLDAHLKSCASCAEYKADADKTMQLLRDLRKRLTPTDPVDQAFDLLSSRLAASRRQMVWALVLVAACVTAPFAMMLRGDLPLTVGGLLLLSLASAGGVAWQISREQSSMVRLTRRTAGFYETWKRDLNRRIRMTTGGAVYVAAWSIGFLFYSVLGPFGLVEQLVVLSAAFLLVVGALHTFFVELPQLKNELGHVRDACRD